MILWLRKLPHEETLKQLILDSPDSQNVRENMIKVYKGMKDFNKGYIHKVLLVIETG